MTRTVAVTLRASNPAADSAEANLLALIENPKPIEALRQRVVAYLERVRTQLDDHQRRAAETARLYRLVLDRRRDAAGHIPALVESPRLFPTGQTP